PPPATLFPYTTLFRSHHAPGIEHKGLRRASCSKQVRRLLLRILEQWEEKFMSSRITGNVGRTIVLVGVNAEEADAPGSELLRQRSEEHTSELQSRGHL